MVELGLVAALGFLGSFGHCLGMCGPIAIAFSFSEKADRGGPLPASRWRQLRFHLLLNLGRLVSYILVGAAIGGLGSVLVAGGQMAGVGSGLRRGMALLTGLLLIFLGLRQVAPKLFAQISLQHPFSGVVHQRLQTLMGQVSSRNYWWTPAALGLMWGCVPCGFLYVAQIKAAEASAPLMGAVVMAAFGVGTLPMMVLLGASSAWFSRDRTSQLFQCGGWITLLIGVLTLTRTGDLMVDYTGHLAIAFLAMALVARPLSKVWAYPLRCRRLLGVWACVLAMAHTLHMLEHSWQWRLTAVRFMLPQHQWAMVAGGIALLLMVPLVLTSTDRAQRGLGRAWRSLHLLSVPALLLGGTHCLLVGSTYLGNLQWQGEALVRSLGFAVSLGAVLAVRSPIVWKILGLEKWYAPPQKRRLPHPADPAVDLGHRC